MRGGGTCPDQGECAIEAADSIAGSIAEARRGAPRQRPNKATQFFLARGELASGLAVAVLFPSLARWCEPSTAELQNVEDLLPVVR